MNKFRHLHTKIRHVRSRLGLKQKEFILKVSQRLGLGEAPFSQGLVSQWESRKTTPTAPQICAIASLTKQPWKTMAWFMHDDLPASRGVKYFPDGTFLLAPKTADADMHEFFSILENQESSKPSAEILTAWERDPRKIFELREKLVGQIEPEDTGSNLVEVIQSTGKPDVTVDLIGVSSNVKPSKVQPAPENKESKSALMGGIAQFLNLRLDQAVKFPERDQGPIHLSSVEASESDFEDRRRRRVNFDETVVYLINQTIRSQNATNGLDRIITAGSIRARPYFYFYGVSAVREMLEPSFLVVNIPNLINEKIGQLLLIDRLQGKSAKKLVLFSIYESGIDLTHLRDMYYSYIKSAERIGITIAFTSGATETAAQITSMIASHGVDI
jgi:transcriptional regulator with XRE-family HTH domain